MHTRGERARTLLRVVASSVVLVVAGHGSAMAATAGSSADAYSLLLDVRMSPSHTPVVLGPLARAAQDWPGPQSNPSEAQQSGISPIPADGSLVNHLGVATSIAGAAGDPHAVASAEVTDVSLLKHGETTRITADLVRAQANSGCHSHPNSNGTTFVNLRVGGTPMESSPAPNTVMDLVDVRVILNEQRPAADGRGIVVNAIHVMGTTAGDSRFRGSLIVGHAESSVSCPDGPGTSGSASLLPITTRASRSVVGPGAEVAYEVEATNGSSQHCLLDELVLHVPPGFEYVRTSGTLGELAMPRPRPGGGSDLRVRIQATWAALTTLRQTFVLRTSDATRAGAAFVNPELRCVNFGQFMGGVSAPVLVDMVAPDTAIDAGPTGAVADPTPEFAFSATEAETTFECQVDDRTYAACSSPHRPAALAEGPHVLRVRAVDAGSNVDGSPAERAFSVDTVPPDTTIESGPAGPVAVVPEFGFSTAGGTAFECRVDDGPFAACAAPARLEGLPDGPHAFAVRALDAAGNVDASPAERSFVLDTMAPGAPVVVDGPKRVTASRTARLTWTGEPGAAFACSLDGGPFAACASPSVRGSLRVGTHELSVRQIDAAGNVGPAVTHAWRVHLSATLRFGTRLTLPAGVVCRVASARPLRRCGIRVFPAGTGAPRNLLAQGESVRRRGGGAAVEVTVKATPAGRRRLVGAPEGLPVVVVATARVKGIERAVRGSRRGRLFRR